MHGEKVTIVNNNALLPTMQDLEQELETAITKGNSTVIIDAIIKNIFTIEKQIK